MTPTMEDSPAVRCPEVVCGQCSHPALMHTEPAYVDDMWAWHCTCGECPDGFIRALTEAEADQAHEHVVDGDGGGGQAEDAAYWQRRALSVEADRDVQVDALREITKSPSLNEAVSIARAALHETHEPVRRRSPGRRRPVVAQQERLL